MLGLIWPKFPVQEQLTMADNYVWGVYYTNVANWYVTRSTNYGNDGLKVQGQVEQDKQLMKGNWFI